MRTSVGAGMNQHNRANALFILLRNIGEQEKAAIEEVVKTYFKILLANIVTVFVFGVSIAISGRAGWISAILFLSLAFQYAWIYRVYIKKRLFNRAVFMKIDKMIFSDEFSYSVLSDEELVNMIGDTQASLETARFIKQILITLAVETAVIDTAVILTNIAFIAFL